MTNNLFKKITTLLVALSLVVGVMTGFVFTKTVEVNADEQKVKVYYDFKNLHSQEDFAALPNEVVIFVPATLNVNFRTGPCLPTIPSGSARLVVTQSLTNRTTTYDKEKIISSPLCANPILSAGHYPKEYTAGCKDVSENNYYPYAYVVTLEQGAGFDGCTTGGIYDKSFTGTTYNETLAEPYFVFYGCSGGGVRGLKGNVVSYKTAEVPISSINAMIKDTVEIPSGEAVTITKGDVQMSFSVDGDNYMVPSNLSDQDYKIDNDNKTIYIPAPGSSDPVDDNIDVWFGTTKINVKIHMHDWKYYIGDDGDNLYAVCESDMGKCPVESVPRVKLVVNPNINDKDEKGDPVKACDYEMNLAWNYVGSSGMVINYKSLDRESEPATTVSPTAKGNYRATLKVDGSDGVSYEIAKEFNIDKNGNVIESTQHVHQWKYSKGPDGTLVCECVAKFGDCPLKTSYQITADITGGEHGTGEDYTGTGIVQYGRGEITDPEILEELEMPSPSAVKYRVYNVEVDENGNPKLDEDGKPIYIKDGSGNPTYTEQTTRPEGQGAYEIVQTYTNPDGSTEEVETPFTVFTGKDKHGNPLVGVFSVDVPYRYIYPGTGIDYNNGWIYYTTAQANSANATAEDKAALAADKGYNFVKVDDDKAAREPLYNRPVSSDGSAVPETLYIDMFTEHLYTPSTVEAYRLNKSSKWIAGELKDEDIQKAINKGQTQFAVTYSKLTDKGQPSGVYYTFVTINKRDNCETLKVNYAACADRTGLTNGQFVFTDTNGKVMYNISSKYDVTFASASNAKNPASVGWGVWPSTGGVWVPDILTVNGKEKAGKYTLYVRKTASVNVSGTKFTPASKVKKVSVSTVQKPVSVKADYKKEIIKLKKNLKAYFGEQIIDIRKADFDGNTKDYGTYTYTVVKTATGAALATPAVVTFENLVKDYKYAFTIEDAVAENVYEDLVVDYDNDIKNNPALKSTGLDISGYLTETRNTIQVWQKAIDKKPASVITKIKFAKRGEITSAIEALVKTDDKGKVALTKLGNDNIALEVEVTDKKGKVSWKTTLPTAGKDELVTGTAIGAPAYKIAEAIYPIRIKSDAKGGKETDTSNASGVTRYILVTYKNMNATAAQPNPRSVKVGVDSVQWFDTKEAAEAAKKIVPAAEE